MALYIDSAKILIEEISRHLHSYEEYLALVGLKYCACKAACGTYTLYGAIRAHLWARMVDNSEYVRNFGSWALVTGATDGIGKAYVEELARRGLNVILVSRDQAKLDRVAGEIRKKYGVKTHVVQADFSHGKVVYGKIGAELRDKEVGVLVNNVGTFPSYPMYLHEQDDDTIWRQMNVNVAPVTLLTRMISPQMIARKKGAIINISSGSAFSPLLCMSVYGATKAYNSYFTEVLQQELGPHGIVVQLVCPFYVATNITQHNDAIKGSAFVPDASTFASHAIATLGYTSYTTGYWIHGLQYWAMQFTPRIVARWIYRKLNAAARKGNVSAEV